MTPTSKVRHVSHRSRLFGAVLLATVVAAVGAACSARILSTVSGPIPPPVAIDFHTRGYWDVACGGEGAGGEPTDCQTPVPSPPADAPHRALVVDRLAITIDHTGHYDISVGQAVLPDGYLSQARFRVAGDSLPGITASDGIVLELRSADPAGRPFDNVHSHGVHPGPETVDVHLVLDVTALDRPTTVDVIDLDVH